MPADRNTDDEFVAHYYRLHARSIFHKCLRLSGNPQWAEDITQDVFVRMLEKRDQLDEEKNVAGWLHTVAYRCCLDRMRRDRSIWSRVKAAFGYQRSLERVPAPDAVISARQELAGVMETLAKMPPRVRLVFVMKHLDNLSQQEIARTLGFSKGYVSKLLNRGTGMVRDDGWEVRDD